MTPTATDNSTATRADQPVAEERALRADARRNREAVLGAARKLFAEQGRDAQMEDIAAAAKVGVGTVYRHFPTKDDLVEALAAERFQRMRRQASECLRAEDAWEGFSDFVRYSVEEAAADRALSEVLADRPEMMRGAAEGSGIWEPMSALVARAQDVGAMRADAKPEDVPALICAVGQVTHSDATPAGMNWRRLLAIALDGLRGGGRSELPPPAADTPPPSTRCP